MNFSLWIAKRYFLFGKKLNFINLVSLISIAVISCVTMALVVALSVFNGLEDMIREIFNSFDPEIKISAVKGKAFEYNSGIERKIYKIDGISLVTEVIEDHALAKYKDEQVVVKVKGLSSHFIEEGRINNMIIEGIPKFNENNEYRAIIGQGVQYLLSIDMNSSSSPIQLIYPKNQSTGAIDPQKFLTQELIMPSAVFAIEKQYDDSYIFVPIEFAQSLFGISTKRTAIEIKSNGKRNLMAIQADLIKLLGSDFMVQNSDEQHAPLLKAIRVEKLFMYITISFIFAIASLNIFFCLTMLALKKRKDIAVMYSLGATTQNIKNIFLIEGGLIAFLGVFIGLIAGLGLCLVQKYYGIVSMGMQTSLVDAYPIKLKWLDFMLVLITLIVITFIASLRPALSATMTKIKDYI